jgi:lysophospholipase L1-like esterase
MEYIVVSIQGQGARVIIGGLKFPLRDRGFARGYKDLADQTGVVLIPDIFKDIMGSRKLMRDPIHPNGDGYRIMAQKFLDAMLPR